MKRKEIGNMMKRIISILLLTVLLSMEMITTTFAAEESISVTSVDAKNGETVTVSVELNGNVGFNNYSMTLNYDTDALELTDISGDYVTAANPANGMVSFAQAGVVSDANVTLFTAIFKVKEEASEGTYPVSVTVGRICVSHPYEEMNPSVISGSVNVTVPHVCELVDVVGTDVTCEVDGVKDHQKCACGKYYIDDKEVRAEELVIKATGHTWKWEVDKEATTEETGLQHEACACGATRNEGTVIDKIVADHEHVYGSWKNDSEKHWKECECGQTVSEAHKFKWIVDRHATADAEGQKHEECTECKYNNAAVKIPATGTKVDEVPKTEVSSPKTGDEANLILWLVLMVVSGGLAFCAVGLSKRKKYADK